MYAFYKKKRVWTSDLWFWKPTLYQLNYFPYWMVFLFELQNKLILILISWVFSFLVSYAYKETLWFIVTHTIISLNNFYFVYTNVLEVFMVYFQLSKFVSLQFSFFYTIASIFSFLAPALYKKEYFFLRNTLGLYSALMPFIIFLLVFLIFPYFWLFFTSFQERSLANILHFEIKISDYLKVFTQAYHFLVFYIFFNVFGLLIVKSLFVTKQMKVRFRKLVYFLFLVTISLVINSPDFFLALIS